MVTAAIANTKVRFVEEAATIATNKRSNFVLGSHRADI